MKPRLFVVAALFVTLLFSFTFFLSARGSQLNDRTPSTSAVALGQPGTLFRYLRTYGEAETPYLADTAHLFGASGLFIDGSNNVYVVEQDGHRLLRYNSTGTNTLSIGIAGIGYTDDYVFNYPSDAAVDNGGNIWVADNSRVVQYNSSGIFLQSLPARDDSPGNSGNTNGRFDGARGIAFDSAGHMYVSDSNNHRVQVYDMSTSSPVYSITIGVTGIYSSTDGYFNYPYRIAVDTSNRLYVVDNGNNRVQQCIYGSATWSCTTFDSGLNNPQGITVDSSNNVYISDTSNGRILKCDSGGSCSDLVTNNPEYDVAVDSNGNIFGVDWNDKISKRDSNGWDEVTFVGVEGIPYLTDNYHYFQPRAAIDHSDNILILEDSGQRLVKLNSNGVALWSTGVPGVSDSDNNHFSWPRDLVADTSGDILVHWELPW